jgi:ligand-binding sensor domain-containing protein
MTSLPILIILLLLSACSQKTGISKPKLQVFSGFASLVTSYGNNGLIIYGNDGLGNSFARQANNLVIELPNGNWNFYAVAWELATAAPNLGFTGTPRCGKLKNVSLTSTTDTLDITVSNAACADTEFSAFYKTSSTTTMLPTLELISCKSLTNVGVFGDVAKCDNTTTAGFNQGYASYYRLRMLEKADLTSAALRAVGITSACIPMSTPNPDLRIPSTNIEGLDFEMEIYYSQAPCDPAQGMDIVPLKLAQTSQIKAYGDNTSGLSTDPGKLRFFAAADPTRIYDPQGFNRSSVTLNSITLSWLSGGPLVTGYKLAYQTGTTPPVDCNSGIVLDMGNVLTHVVTGLSTGVDYSFRICSYGAGTNIDPGFTSTFQAGHFLTATFPEDALSIITLNYTEFGHLGTSCNVVALNNVTITQPCTCTSGTCKVGVTGLLHYNGTAGLQYTVSNGGATSSTGFANLNITPINYPPVATNFSGPALNQAIQGIFTLPYTDVESEQATLCTVTNLNHVNVTQACACASGICTVGVTNVTSYSGPASFDFSVNDSQPSNIATASFMVNAVDHPPVASGIPTGFISSAGLNIITLPYNDPDGDLATSCNIFTPTNILVSQACACTSGICTVGLTASTSLYVGPASFSYQVMNSATSNMGSASFQVFCGMVNGSTPFYTIPQGYACYTQPAGNFIHDSFVDSSGTIYMATDGGLSISNTGGTSFVTKTTSMGLGSNNIMSVSGIPGKIFAGTFSGLFVSTNGGVSFTNVTPIGNTFVSSIYYHTLNSTLYVSTNNGLWISTDSGLTFSQKTTANGLGTNQINHVHINTSGHIYVSTMGSGVAVSSNGGATFTSITTTQGLIDNYPNSSYSFGSSLYVSSNGGLSVSHDSGATFTHALTSTNVFKVYASSTYVFAATQTGFAISTDAGATFINKTQAQGIGSTATTNLYVHTNNDIYLSTQNGLSYSNTNGSLFSANYKNSQGLTGNSINKIFIGPNDKLFVATQGGGVAISSNKGSTFTTTVNANGIVGYSARGLSVGLNGNIYAATDNGLAVSTNGGATYSNKTTSNGLIDNFISGGVFVDSSDVIYAATNSGLSISTDYGTSFTNKTTANGLASNTIQAVRAFGTMVYAATSGGLSVSSNSGGSFTTKTTANGLGANNVLALYVHTDGRVFAGTFGGGLSVSTNNGTSFTNITTSNGLASNYVRGIYVGPTGTIYVGTDSGLSISTTGGASFTNYGAAQGISGSTVFDIAVDSVGSVYVGTDAGLSKMP